MKKPQWIAAGIALLAVFGLYAATENKIFGTTPRHPAATHAVAAAPGLSVDSLVSHARTHLSPDLEQRLRFLENNAKTRLPEDQLHAYHQLARFWRDTARGIEHNEWFTPYAWYTAEAARLENSEKSLTFAAHLLLNKLMGEADPRLRQWQAGEARDLFERSLKLNPANDSSSVGLGAVYVFGGIALPMEGIGMIRKVADRDTTNVYAQWTLGQASLMSGQYDKAVDRFGRVARLQPSNLEAILLVAETYEQMGSKKEAIHWYGRLLPFVNNENIRQEVQARIEKLKK